MLIKDFLEQPFDYFDTTKTKWIYILSSASFAMVFLVLFQPYGISQEMENPVNPLINKALFFISIGFSTILALSFSQFIGRQIFTFNKVSNKHYSLWFLIEALILLLVNFGLSFIVPDLGDDFEKELNFGFQLKMYPRVLLILLFPFFGTIIYVLITRLNSEIQDLGQQLKNYSYKYKESTQQEFLNILDENGQEDFKLRVSDFLYAEASNQYILVYYTKGEDVKKHIIRTRLKSFLNESQELPIKQCHRSYAVNLINIEHLSRIKGKDFLILKSKSELLKVPISNSYLNEIKKNLMD